ncbi:MAG: hypothetical protein B7Z73_01150 [Planctomycetia bacterium 21-64-5]|nr:MAG: hypothetical protein B7Z73_01150 [Planctomycetia bacterium 21-64-5]
MAGLLYSEVREVAALARAAGTVWGQKNASGHSGQRHSRLRKRTGAMARLQNIKRQPSKFAQRIRNTQLEVLLPLIVGGAFGKIKPLTRLFGHAGKEV